MEESWAAQRAARIALMAKRGHPAFVLRIRPKSKTNAYVIGRLEGSDQLVKHSR
jgi:hypothetical protein